MHTLRAFYCHELYLLCCRHVLIFTPESFSFIGKCFHASPLSRDFALKNKSPCSACEFQAKQGISILGIKLLFFSV